MTTRVSTTVKTSEATPLARIARPTGLAATSRRCKATTRDRAVSSWLAFLRWPLRASLLGSLALTVSTLAGADSKAPVETVDLGKTGTPVAIRVYQIWGSPEAKDTPPPKPLAAFLPRLRKSSRLRSFRLASKPLEAVLIEGKSLTVTLPQAYKASWQVGEWKGQRRVLQLLTNPKKKQSRVPLPKSPSISTLARIRHEGETFLLVVDFARKRS